MNFLFLAGCLFGFPTVIHYFKLKPFISATLQPNLKLHVPIYSIQSIIIRFFTNLSLKFLWKSSRTREFFCPSSNLDYYISSFFKSCCWSSSTFCLALVILCLKPLISSSTSSRLFFPNLYFKPWYFLGPSMVFGRFADPNTDHFSKSFIMHRQLSGSALLELTTFWASNL